MVLRRFGCTEKVINLIKALHNQMQAKVAQGSKASDQFAVTKGVKQGCKIASTLFFLYLTSVLNVAFWNVKEGIYIYRPEAAQTYSMFYVSSQKLPPPNILSQRCFLLTIVHGGS